MVFYTCSKCNKIFNKKCNFLIHLKKIRPCSTQIYKDEIKINGLIPKHTKSYRNHTETIPNHTETISKNTNIKINDNDDKNYINDAILNNITSLMNLNPLNKVNSNNSCIYCDKVFVQKCSLNRHLRDRCKNKKNFDELEKLKEQINSINSNYSNLEKQIDNLKNNSSNNIKNNIGNNVNNGVINNNSNMNVQLVQFGSENIDDIDSKKALDVYFKSTGGNILSNVFKLVNSSDDHPENHNICLTDLSREIVKIFNGEKFIVKKFKSVREDIMFKIIKNTFKLIEKIKNDKNIVLTPVILSKFKINNVSLMLINGCLPEDIVKDEKKEKMLNLKNEENNDENNSDNDSNLSDKIVFNLEDKMRISQLENKQSGLIDISIERLKDELYNGKDKIEKIESKFKKNNNKK